MSGPNGGVVSSQVEVGGDSDSAASAGTSPSASLENSLRERGHGDVGSFGMKVT